MKERLRNEINLIKDPNIKLWIERTLDNAPERFWKIPASSTGKYHPECTNVEGGLIVHVKRVVYIANRLCYGWNIRDSKSIDIVIAACIIHDLAKTGKDSGAYMDYVNHPILAEKHFAKSVWTMKDDNTYDIIKNCVAYHMGPWTPKSINKPLGQYTPLELCVYTSDYMASTKELVTPVDGMYTIKET